MEIEKYGKVIEGKQPFYMALINNVTGEAYYFEMYGEDPMDSLLDIYVELLAGEFPNKTIQEDVTLFGLDQFGAVYGDSMEYLQGRVRTYQAEYIF